MVKPELTSFELAMLHFVRREPFRPTANQGYSTTGKAIRINGHTIAVWHDGACRMFLDHPEFHGYHIAVAIPKVRKYLKDSGYYAARDEKICKEHEDCRKSSHNNYELGRVCVSGHELTKMQYRPYFEVAAERREIASALYGKENGEESSVASDGFDQARAARRARARVRFVVEVLDHGDGDS